MIREAELQTDLSVQQKQQEIEESKVQNKRVLLKRNIELETERREADIEAEKSRKSLVDLAVENSKLEAEAEAFEIAERMKAFRELPVANLKAMAMANMKPEQLLALAIEALAENANKIGELNLSPDLVNQFARKVKRS